MANQPATKVVTGKIRFSYVNVFKPRAASEGQEPKYSACLLIPKSDKTTITRIKAACEAARMGSASLFNGKVPEKLKLPIHDGDGEMPNGGEYGEECKGHWVINVSSKSKPGIVDRDKQEILNSSEFYSGCYGRAAINFYAYNVNGNKGIAAGLNNVQKLTEGEPLGGRSRAEDDFSDDWDDDDDDFLD